MPMKVSAMPSSGASTWWSDGIADTFNDFSHGRRHAAPLHHEFRGTGAQEAPTRGNMRSWAHAQISHAKHPGSSEQTKQGRVPASCGTRDHPSAAGGRASRSGRRLLQRLLEFLIRRAELPPEPTALGDAPEQVP